MIRNLVLLISLLIATTAGAATYGQVFQSLLTQQRATGAVLSGGKVYFYTAGTENLATVWTSRTKATPAANPGTLSADGTLAVYGDGQYDVKITTAAGVQKFYWYGVSLVDASTVTANDAAFRAYTSIDRLPSSDGRIAAVKDVSQYSSFPAAVTAIGSTKTTLRYGADISLADDLTIPETLVLQPYNGAVITVASGKVLTVNSPYVSANVSRFTGAGKVTLNATDEIPTAWFGSTPDATTTDNRGAFQKAIDCAKRSTGTPTVVIPPGDYRMDLTVAVWPGVNVVGQGKVKINRYGFPSWNGSAVVGTQTMFTLYGSGRFENIEIDGRASAHTYAAFPSTDPPSPPYINEINIDHSYLDASAESSTADPDKTTDGTRKTVIRNCYIHDSAGTPITGTGRGVIIENNRFGYYRDHGVYFSGTAAAPTYDVLVKSNIFSVPTADFEYGNVLWKVRDSAKRVMFTGNTVNIPEDTLVTIDQSGTLEASEVIVSSNVGTVKYPISVASSTGTNNNKTTFTSNSLTLSALDYWLLIGSFGGGYSFGSVSLTHNKFTIPATSLEGIAFGTSNSFGNKLIVQDNEFYGAVKFTPAGYIDTLMWDRNKHYNAGTTIGALFVISEVAPPLSTAAHWYFRDNITEGYLRLLSEGNSTAYPVLSVANVTFTGNNQDSDGDYTVAASGTPFSSYSGANRMTIKGNNKPSTVAYPLTNTVRDCNYPEIMPTFADNAAALAGGLIAGKCYKTSTGEARVTY